MDAMSMPHMHPDGHMRMTPGRPVTTADRKRAEQIVAQLRQALARYRDVRVAEADGYRPFLEPEREAPPIGVASPRSPRRSEVDGLLHEAQAVAEGGKHELHYNNRAYARLALRSFDPQRPSSLLYRSRPDGTLRLMGAMYTAPRQFSEEQLNERIPLSIAHWHAHVNLCLPPLDPRTGMPLGHTDWRRFGPRGSIHAQASCLRAGGHFLPQIFGWMVHVYPFESSPAAIWMH